jgi:hypothetical protein
VRALWHCGVLNYSILMNFICTYCMIDIINNNDVSLCYESSGVKKSSWAKYVDYMCGFSFPSYASAI